MPSTAIPGPRKTIEDLIRQLGDIPANRIIMDPLPGTATRRDVVRLQDKEPKQLCELVDKTLVEKAMGSYQSAIGVNLIIELGLYLRQNDIGFLTSADGGFRIGTSVGMPDVAFISWGKYTSREDRTKYTIQPYPPDLAAEILSEGNTPKEIARKVREYLAAGVRLVWVFDLKKKTVVVHRCDGSTDTLTQDESLSGEDVLPGLTIPIRNITG